MRDDGEAGISVLRRPREEPEPEKYFFAWHGAVWRGYGVAGVARGCDMWPKAV